MGISQAQLDAILKANATASTDAWAAADKNRWDQEAAKKDADVKLAQLIKGKELDQEAIDANFRAADEAARAAGLQPGKYSVNAGVGSRSYNPENEGIMALLGLQDRRDREKERKVTQLSDRVTKNQLPQQITTMRTVEQATTPKDEAGNPIKGAGGMLTDPNYQPKSVGPFINMVPDFAKSAAVNLGEKLKMLPKGAGDEQRAIQQVINFDTRGMSGTAVTEFELFRNKLAQGLAAGADPALVRQYMQEAYRRLQTLSQETEGGFSPEIKETYKQYGGELPSEMLQFGGTQQRFNQTPTPQTKTIGGKTYIRTQRGWEEQ